MEEQLLMREELYNSDFCFPLHKIFSKNNIDLTKKIYGFDCNIGSFCCYANKENIYKIINIAKKYELENLFLHSSFDKNELLEFKMKTIEELNKDKLFPNDIPVIFWFLRSRIREKEVYLKDYLNL